MDDDAKSEEAVAAVARASLTKTLREQFPFMKTALVTQAVEEAVACLQKQVEAAKPQMAATKAEISFFSLAAEIRNEIYELALPSEEDFPRVEFDERLTATRGLGPEFIYDKAKARHEIGKKAHMRSTFVGFPALLHVSSQVRAESLPIFLSKVNVLVGVDRYATNTKLGFSDEAPIAKAWLYTLGRKHANMIKRFVLTAETTGIFTKVSNKEILDHLGINYSGLRSEAVRIFEYGLRDSLWREHA